MTLFTSPRHPNPQVYKGPMRQCLSNNPHDIQANAYFDKKIRKENVQRVDGKRLDAVY
jgi:hypothetical protein